MATEVRLQLLIQRSKSRKVYFCIVKLDEFLIRELHQDRHLTSEVDLLDRQYAVTPFYGQRRLRAWLAEKGYSVNIKRLRRLMGVFADFR